MTAYEYVDVDDLMFSERNFAHMDAMKQLSGKVGLELDNQNGTALVVTADKWEEVDDLLDRLKELVAEQKARRPKTVKLSLEVDVPGGLTQYAIESIMHAAAAQVSKIDYVIESRVMEA